MFDKKVYHKVYYLAHKEQAKIQKKAWYLAHKEQTNIRSKNWQLAHPERRKIHRKNWQITHPEQMKAYNKAWWLAHPEKARDYQKTYRHLYPEKVNTSNRIYRKTHPGKMKVFDQKHKARRRSLDFIPLNFYHEGCDFHHIDKIYGIYIPKEIHTSIKHSVLKNVNMDRINNLAFNYLVNHLEGLSLSDVKKIVYPSFSIGFSF